MKGTIISVKELAEFTGQSESDMSVEISEIFNKIIYRTYKECKGDEPDMVDICLYIIEETGITVKHLYNKLDDRNLRLLRNDAIKRKTNPLLNNDSDTEQTVDEVLM